MDARVISHLDALLPPRRDEAEALVRLFAQTSGYEPMLWPGGIIGFGRYAYRYDSGHSGETLATGFAARKAEIVLYPGCALDGQAAVLARLGRHRLGKGCVYLKRLADADRDALAELIAAGLAEVAQRWTVQAT